MSGKRMALVATLFGVGTFGLAGAASAANVYHCTSNGQKCVVKAHEGIIGDHIKVLDEKARVIAHGRLIKRRGAYAIMAVVKNSKTIRKGYPVIVDVENRNSNMQWAASFSNSN